MEVKYLASLQELIDAIQSIDEQIIVHWYISRMDEAKHVYRRYQASKAFPKYFLSYQDANPSGYSCTHSISMCECGS